MWSKTRCPNDCSGHGNCTVVYSFEANANVGRCECAFGYGGVDCANEIDNRSPGDKLYDNILVLEQAGRAVDDDIALAKKKVKFALGILNNKTKVWDLIQETNITKLKARFNKTKKALNDALELVETRRKRLQYFEFTEFPQIKDGKRGIREAIDKEGKVRLAEEQLKRKRVAKILTLRDRYKKEGRKLPDFIGWEKFVMGGKTQYYNTLTEANSYDAPKEGLGFRVDEYEPYVKKYSKDMGLTEDGGERATSLVELPTQKPPRVRDEASVPYDIYNSKRVLDAKSRLRNVTVNGKKHLVVLRRKVVEAEKALLVAKVNFNEASQALAFGIDVGMSPMQMARTEYNKAKADLAKLRKNRRVIDRKILAAKEKAKQYTDTVLQTMSSIMEGDVALNGAAAENSNWEPCTR